ncbi:MAG: PAS domain-containing protein, partial [Spirochaetota bacterium]
LESRIKTLEESLKKEKAERAELFNEMIAGLVECELIFDKDQKAVDFKFITANKNFCKITGQECSTIAGKYYNTIFPNIDPIFAQKVHSIIQGKSAPVFEYYYPATTGHYEISIKRLTDKRFRCYFHDITFYKLAEKNLHKSEKRFSLALASTNDGIWDWDMRTNHVYYSPRWKTMLGYEPDELRNNKQTWEALIHPEDHERTKQLFKKYMSGTVDKFEIINRMQHKNGEWKLIFLRATKELDKENNRITHLVGTHADVTELISLLNNLNELNNTKDKFFSIVAHDLRGPLSSFSALIELILEDKSMTREETDELLKEVHVNSKNIYWLLENLLLWAQSQMNHISINMEKISLSPLIRENIQLFSGMAKDKEIKIISKIEEDICLIADSNILRFILRNLISNAIKFSYRKGIVEIDVHVDEANKAVISISDNGKGIENDRIDLLLASSQINSTMGTENEKGSGLGLILCSDFVKKIDGEINIESKKYKGTTVTIKLQGCPKVQK